MLDINKLTVGELKSLAKLASGLGACDATAERQEDGRAVIVRSRDQGVMFGRLTGIEGTTVHLSDAVQMWRWKAEMGGTLVDCAQFGVDREGCKFSEGSAAVSILNACAIIDCSKEGEKSLSGVCRGDWS